MTRTLVLETCSNKKITKVAAWKHKVRIGEKKFVVSRETGRGWTCFVFVSKRGDVEDESKNNVRNK